MKFSDFLSTFDWISPAISLANQARGKTVICATDQFSNIEKLRAAGIRPKNITFDQRGWTFDVSKKDAKRAAQVLGKK